MTCEAFAGFDARLHRTGPEKDEAKVTHIFDELRLAAIDACGHELMLPVLFERADRLLDDRISSAAPPMLLRAMARILEKRGELIPERFDGLVAQLLHAFPPDPQIARKILTSVVTQERRERIVFGRRGQLTFGPAHDYSDLLSEEMRRAPDPPKGPMDAKLAELGASLFKAVESLMPRPPT